MSQDEINDQEINNEVKSEIESAKKFTKQINFDEVKNGEWFIQLLRQVFNSYQKNARAEYFQQKYPGLSPDEIADILISVTARYAAIAGAITGVAVTTNQISLITSAGMTAALFVTSIGAEMVYLARLQIRLILDIAVIYDLQLDADDPEDILMIFGYALGVATPTELVGKGLQTAAQAGTRRTIKTYISKTTLKTIQDFARQLGFKILQRSMIKYAVPAVSAAVGSGYNYAATLSVGKIAKTHFKNRGKVTEELRVLVSRQNIYDLIYPAAVKHIALVDGEYSKSERELFGAILSRMTFDPYSQEEFHQLLKSEDNILEAIAQIQDANAIKMLMELLILMAVYDGKFVEEERLFLQNAAQTLGIMLDFAAIENKAKDYSINYSDSRWRKIAETTGVTLTSAKDTTSQFFQLSSKTVKTGFRKLFNRKTDDISD